MPEGKWYLLSEEHREAIQAALRNLDYARGKLDELKGPKHVSTEIKASTDAIYQVVAELPEAPDE